VNNLASLIKIFRLLQRTKATEDEKYLILIDGQLDESIIEREIFLKN